MAREADVIVVGAGLSGLIAARDVLAAGHEPLILEADQRVGGRILTEDVEGVPVELGAQWIGDTHHRMEALASELGVGIYPQFEDGETSYEFAGEVLREQAFNAKYADELSGVERVLRKLDQMAETVPVDTPWLAPEADVWDRVTAGQWYDSQGLSRVARTLLEICTVGILAVPTVEVSLLCLLLNVAVCGVTADLLAESEGRGGLVAAGRQVIVALSPALAGRIMYDPPLPGVRDQLTQRMPHASAHKMFAIYDEPFWRRDGLNGQLISEVGPARMSNDSCLPDEAGGPGIILAFLEGESARVAGRWPAEQRQRALRAELGRHFGQRAAEPQRIVERGWADREWIRGCYNSNLGPCGLLHFGPALSKPIGPIKWAATETASAWSGYMEGAVEAGHRAAREALEGI